jgi:hypothetical protein
MLKDGLLLLGGLACGVVIMLGSASQGTTGQKDVEMIAGSDKDGVIVWHLRNGRIRSCYGAPPVMAKTEAPKCGPWSED